MTQHRAPRRHRPWRAVAIVVTAIVGLIVGVSIALSASHPAAVKQRAATASPVAASASPLFTVPDDTPAPDPTPTQTEDDTTGPLSTVFTVTSTNAETGDPVVYDVSAVAVDANAKLGAYETTLKPGDHMAAVRFKITGRNGSASDDALLNASVVTGDTSQVTASFLTIADGEPFASGTWRVGPGRTVSGWVAFELPAGQKVAEVTWVPGGGFDGTAATWTVG